MGEEEKKSIPFSKEELSVFLQLLLNATVKVSESKPFLVIQKHLEDEIEILG